MLCFNWLRVIFLQSSANLWPRSPPTGQIFCENCNLSTGFTHMRVSPLLSGFAMLPTGYYTERKRESFPILFTVSVSVFHINICISMLFSFLFCLQSTLPSARVECMRRFEGGQQFFWSSFICFYCAHFLQSWIYSQTGSCQNLALHYHVCKWWSLKIGVCE